MEQKENTEIIPAVNVEDVVKAQLNCFTRISLMIKKYLNCLCSIKKVVETNLNE